jgi:hypothetical protein
MVLHCDQKATVLVGRAVKVTSTSAVVMGVAAARVLGTSMGYDGLSLSLLVVVTRLSPAGMRRKKPEIFLPQLVPWVRGWRRPREV